MTHLTDEQLARIRQTIQPTVDEWRRDYGIPEGKEHGQLVNRVVAAIWAVSIAWRLRVVNLSAPNWLMGGLLLVGR